VQTVRTIVLLALLAGGSAGAWAQEPLVATVQVAVSTQSTIPLSGALVELRDRDGIVIAQRVADGEGIVRFVGVARGQYRLVASLDGFQTTEVLATAADATVFAVIDLPIAITDEHVDVVAPAVTAETMAKIEGISGDTVDQYGGVAGLEAALRLLASVIMVPGGASIKGGRPAQASTQVGSGMLIDPSTGFVRFTFPADSIDSVQVLPNPYEVEYGRFSSGLVVIRTRQAALDTWRTRVGDLDPSLHTQRYQPFHVTGLAGVSPWVQTGGPLISNRLFLEQGVQYNFSSVDVPSRPEDERKVTHALTSFTRVDANLSTNHSLAGTLGFSPGKRTNETMGTFTPPEAAADLSNRTGNSSLIQRSVWSSALLSEATVQLQQFTTNVTPHGVAPMLLYPETTFGDFFNVQRRETTTVQWIQSVSATRKAWGFEHALKGGIDVFHTDFAGSSVSRPVLIRRSDGAPTRRIDFIGPTNQSVQSTDVAAFVQDRVQLVPRWLVEFGGRLDRDGIVQRVNATPRVGTVVLLNEMGTTLLRGGFGLFYERIPSVAGAFEQFERRVDTRYAADGVTPLGPPVIFVPRLVLGPAPPRGRTWDVTFEHRFNKVWSLTASYLDRQGANELVVQPLTTAGGGEMRLDSSGRSAYRDAEITARFKTPPADFTLTYVRSIARADLNSFTNFYDVVMRPVIGANAYAPADTDVPHRLFGRGRYQPTDRWLLTGVADWRTGFPYSVVDGYLDYVGLRNVGYRFPNRFVADLGIERRFTGIKGRPWIGIRAYNAFDSFIPTDVQANLSSPAFGNFYNSQIQQIRLQIRLER
jgi:TonB-dependent receptor-like protein